MSRRARWLALLPAAAVIASLATAPSRAATPDEGSLREDGDRVDWTGSFDVSNPVACTGPSDPTCDHLLLEIDPASSGTLVRISIAADVETDDIDLYVYNEAGTQVARSAGEGGAHELTMSNPPAGTYEVRVQPYAVGSPGSYAGSASLTVDGNTNRDLVIDHGANGCLEAVPATVGVAGVTDPGDDIALDVLVLIDALEDDGDPAVDDDLTIAEMERMRALAAEHSYGPLGIDVRFTYERVHFASEGRVTDPTFDVTRERADATRLIADAKAHVGGTRPDGFDVVYVATAKDIYAAPADDAVMGLADCIGGVRFGDAAFAVGEAGDAIDADLYLFGLGEPTPRLLANAPAKVFAHEVGHLLGNHHHYGECPTGALNTWETFEENEFSPCSLMFPDATLISLSFGPTTSLVTRGHADDFARP